MYYVYLLMNERHTVIYTGVTNNLARRLNEHQSGLIKGFTQKYNVHKLVYYEVFKNIIDAIQREKQIKAGSRRKKLELIKGSTLSLRGRLRRPKQSRCQSTTAL